MLGALGFRADSMDEIFAMVLRDLAKPVDQHPVYLKDIAYAIFDSDMPVLNESFDALCEAGIIDLEKHERILERAPRCSEFNEAADFLLQSIHDKLDSVDRKTLRKMFVPCSTLSESGFGFFELEFV